MKSVKKLFSTLTSDERWGVLVAFEEVQPQIFGQLVTSAPKAIAPPVCANDRLVVTSGIQYSSFSYALTDAGLSDTNAQTRSLPNQERFD